MESSADWKVVEPTPASDLVTRDPVCGMTVNPGSDTPCFEHDGQMFHFCHESCRDKFSTAPDLYIEATDPVCGMQVRRASAHFITRHAGQGHYFCSSHCQDKFEADPDTYLEGRPTAEPAPEGALYHLPDGPGNRARGTG